MKRPLEEKPEVRIEVVEDRSVPRSVDDGFLRLRRLTLKNHYADGTTSRDYRYDCVERDATDAVGIVLVDRTSGTPRICLRSSIRPPLARRATMTLPIPEHDTAPTLFEIPAGLVERTETGEDGLRRTCARETLEEVGLVVPPDAFRRLGRAFYLSSGVLPEKLHLFVADVDARDRGAPTTDDSPVEEHARIEFVAIDEALRAIDDGRLEDVKTEVAIHRVARGL